MKFRFQTVKTANNSNPTANIRKRMIKGHKYSKNLRKFCGIKIYLYLCTRLAES